MPDIPDSIARVAAENLNTVQMFKAYARIFAALGGKIALPAPIWTALEMTRMNNTASNDPVTPLTPKEWQEAFARCTPKEWQEAFARCTAYLQKSNEDCAHSVQAFREAVTPCPVCGHVMEISDDGSSFTVCPCLYADFLKLPAAQDACPVLSGGVKIFVVNTEKSPYHFLPGFEHSAYGPSPLEPVLPVMQRLDSIYDNILKRMTKKIPEST